MHTLLDLHGNIPTFIHITEGRVHDVNILDEFLPEAGAFYVMDRGYIDFERLFVFTLCSAFFVVRTKENVFACERRLLPIQWTRHTGVRSDHDRDSDRDRFRKSLSRFLAPSQLSRYRNKEATQVLALPTPR